VRVRFYQEETFAPFWHTRRIVPCLDRSETTKSSRTRNDRGASAAGNNLTVKAGGANAGGTDLAGGNLVLSSGISSGTGSSGINFNIYKAAGSSGSVDNVATTAMAITGVGNVGIATTAPNAMLDVGAALPSGSYNVPEVAGFYAASDNFNVVNIARSGVSQAQGLAFGVNQAGLYSEIQASQVAHAADALILQRQGGNVGIGMSTPVNLLDVYGAAAIGTSYAGVSTAPANGLLVQGNVGIGTTAPAYLLHVGSPTGIPPATAPSRPAPTVS
jgi:hypothetical protein